MIPDFNYAFRDRNYNRSQTIAQNKIIMQINKGPVPYGVKILKCARELNNKSRNQSSEYNVVRVLLVDFKDFRCS